MIEAGGEVCAKRSDRTLGDRNVGVHKLEDGCEPDLREVTLPLRLAKRERLDKASTKVLSVGAMGRGRELNNRLWKESVTDGSPRAGGHVVCFVD